MKAAFYTLGCKVNQYESEYMAELLRSAGFEIVSPDQEADYYIVNSCTVTATADQKTRQSVRRFKRRHPGATVILTGCMPQAFPEEAKAQLDADIVFSNKSDGDIFSIINRYHTEKSRIVDINAHQTGDPFAPCAISGFGQRVRAFVKIDDGCDRFCSYCIIPKSRGRVRSKAPADLEKEVQDLAAHGIKEIVLVGINLSAYGKGQDFDLLDAVAICDRTPGIARVRLGNRLLFLHESRSSCPWSKWHPGMRHAACGTGLHIHPPCSGGSWILRFWCSRFAGRCGTGDKIFLSLPARQSCGR